MIEAATLSDVLFLGTVYNVVTYLLIYSNDWEFSWRVE